MASSTALRLTGRDSLALLHRISTNAMAELAPGQVRATLFCDFRGRLIHRAVIGVTGDGAVWLLRDDAPGEPLAAFLDRHIFRDDVRIEDHSARLAVAIGARGPEPRAGTLSERDGIPLAARVESGEMLGVGDGAAAGPSDPAERERMRVRAGRPAHGHEIVDAFTPFEVGLAHEVHLDKGCFTGQETLMRLITYRSVKRRLARVRGDGPAPDAPAELRADDQPAGVVTTAVNDGERWIGLAVVRNEVCVQARELVLPDTRVTASLEPLPLTRPHGRG